MAVAGEARLSPQLLSGCTCSIKMWFALKAESGGMWASREPSPPWYRLPLEQASIPHRSIRLVLGEGPALQ